MTKALEWVTESWENLETRYRIKSVLYEQKTEFQHMLLVESFQFGKMLVLDGVVQTTEKDEFYYHEMMAHVPIMTHPDPGRVLIIGGGDGGVLREALRHARVQKVTVVEIDPAVVAFSKKHLPKISDGAFEDERTDLVFADGASFIQQTKNKYDVVIVDSPDPVGPAQVLFRSAFYKDLLNVMHPGGIMVRQTGSLHLQQGEQKQAHDILKKMFAHVGFFVFTVPTYVGGLFSGVFCANNIDPLRITYEKLNQRMMDMGLNTQYYNAGIHLGSFHVPRFFKDQLK
jgi:spermidine synthase